MDMIALHEAGHVVALAAVGIYDEFVNVTADRTVYAGQPVEGLTIRNGRSLTDFSNGINGSHARGPRQYAEYMLANAVDSCFPHICFFAGGYAIENCFGAAEPEDIERRVRIDKENVRSLVMPAMGLPAVPDNAFNMFWNWGVGLVKSAIVSHESDVLSLVDLIRERRTIDRVRMDEAFGGVAQKIAQSADFQNDDIVKQARAQYDAMFRQQNQWLENLQ